MICGREMERWEHYLYNCEGFINSPKALDLHHSYSLFLRNSSNLAKQGFDIIYTWQKETTRLFPYRQNQILINIELFLKTRECGYMTIKINRETRLNYIITTSLSSTHYLHLKGSSHLKMA